MTVEQTVRQSLLMYPSVSRNRWDAYEHLFCVIGNGYDWKDGELVYAIDTEKPENTNPSIQDAVNHLLYMEVVKSTPDFMSKNIARAEEIRVKENPTSEDWEEYETLMSMVDRHNKRRYEYLKQQVDMIFDIENRMKDCNPPTIENYPIVKHFEPKDIYPLCEYSALCCIPDNVKPDWYEACHWMYNWIIAHPDYIRSEDKKHTNEWLQKIKEKHNW